MFGIKISHILTLGDIDMMGSARRDPHPKKEDKIRERLEL